jgi:hypothetical protein
VSTRDRDRRPQLVRRVADEVALALGRPPDLLERGLTPPCVPDRRDEHRA